MSNYTKSTNFATKDNLSPGDPLKIVRGTEIDTEFNNIATAISTKTDNSAAAITGGSISGITDLAVADGGTGASTAAGALNNLLPSQTGNATKYLQTDGTNATWDAVSLSTSDITGTLPVANGGTGVTSSTGTGSVVLSNSPTLVTPALGTPASGVATNLTGLPISTGVSGLGTGVATFLATPSSANLATAVSDETGSGALVFANSPTLVTPALGTPSSATLTNATGLPISTGVSGLGTGIATFLGTPSSANLISAVTDETGTGSLVFATSPTLVTPALGTPSSATLTNATGLPIATGVSGLGTGVATALAVNVGSAGAPVVNGGALGTPSSGTVTNLTGTASININGTVGATTPTTGAFTTVAASSSVTLSGGTANGVTYLNGSKVLTSGSALTFDGTSLAVGGVPTVQGELNVFKTGSAPTLYVQSDASNSTTQGIIRIGGGSGRSASIQGFREASSNTHALRFYSYNSADQLNYEITSGGNSIWSVGGSEQMRLTSTGLGIGTSSPAYKLDVTGTINSGASNATGYNLVFRTSGITTGRAQTALTNTSGDFYTGIEGSTAGATLTGSAAYSAFAGTFTNNPLYLVTNGTIKATLNASGNLGLGVTPSAWVAYKALQVGSTGGALSSSSSSDFEITTNAYYSGGWLSQGAGVASSRYRLLAGSHAWFNAPSGTAGSAISFTQAMTLDANGNLGVGTTSPSNTIQAKRNGTTDASNSQFISENRSGASGQYALYGTRFDDGSGSGFTPVAFGGIQTAAAGRTAAFIIAVSDTDNIDLAADERARIDSSGNLLVGTTSAVSGGGVLQVSNGITFPATQSASSNANTLDDYEEGTWTPVDASGAGLTLTSATGFYTKVGRVVTVSGQWTFPSTVNASNVAIGGLPFAAGANSTGSQLSNAPANDMTLIPNGTANIYFYTLSFSRRTNANYSVLSFYFSASYRV